MRQGLIAAIKIEQTNVEKKLFDIIKRWLNETNPAPTAANLVDALRHPIVGENLIARKIEKEFYPQSSSKFILNDVWHLDIWVNV